MKIVREGIDMKEVVEKLSPEGYAPKQTGKAYKVFKVKNGKLYPPMVSNAGGADTPIGVWLDAEEGEFAGLSKTGRPQVKSSGGEKLSYRPGWHLGDIPRAKQFDRKNKETGESEFPKDFVWAECDYAMDVNYQDESDERGYMRSKVDEEGNVVWTKSNKYQHSLAGLPKLPKDGYYKYRTNPRPDTVPWVITGQMRVNRLLSDDEVNEILKKNGIEPIHRQGGDKTLKELGLNESFQLDEGKRYRRMNKSLFGDPTGKIKTFAIVSADNPLGWSGCDDEEKASRFAKWERNKGVYNKEARKDIKTALNSIMKTGNDALRIGNFSYVEISGHYEDIEKSYMIFNINKKDAEAIARDFGQESFFYGVVGEDSSSIAYYKTFNCCATYRLVEITETVTDENSAEDFFSKYGKKFRINMREFGDEVPEIVNNGEFEESMNELGTFMSRASHRRRAFLQN